jgi:hypothetical protein
VRRGRKARDLSPEARDRPAAGPKAHIIYMRDMIVKANLARFTLAMALLASMAMTLAAGWRW